MFVKIDKTYLGDGVYLVFDGEDITLTTDNGMVETNRIVLEPEVLASFLRFLIRNGILKNNIQDEL